MKEKKFIKKSIYPGGGEALKKFIKTNLKYPKDALKHKIEGDVFLKFKVNPLGQVFDTRIINGIGYGCDEEAVRLIKKLKYPKLLNRKIKVTTNKKISIKFRLPKNNNRLIINYEITPQ
tara:strand:+ start:362 stop:718 length:357 start_codon:yes stop_codon:yes gene_type:complete